MKLIPCAREYDKLEIHVLCERLNLFNFGWAYYTCKVPVFKFLVIIWQKLNWSCKVLFFILENKIISRKTWKYCREKWLFLFNLNNTSICKNNITMILLKHQTVYWAHSYQNVHVTSIVLYLYFPEICNSGDTIGGNTEIRFLSLK